MQHRLSFFATFNLVVLTACGSGMVPPEQGPPPVAGTKMDVREPARGDDPPSATTPTPTTTAAADASAPLVGAPEPPDASKSNVVDAGSAGPDGAPTSPGNTAAVCPAGAPMYLGGKCDPVTCTTPERLLALVRGPSCAGKPAAPWTKSGRGAGCGKAPPASGMVALEVCAGRTRHFRLQLPTGYEPGRAYPVVFSFHHGGGFASSALGYGGLTKQLGDKAIIVAPQALASATACNGSSWARELDDDLAFFDSVLAWVDDHLCTDRGRLFATGLSKGGGFTNALSCRRGDVLRATLSAYGGERGFEQPCRGSTITVIGQTDVKVPQRYAKTYGCSVDQAPKSSWPNPRKCVAYQGCPSDRPVHHCNEGHYFVDYYVPAIGELIDRFK